MLIGSITSVDFLLSWHLSDALGLAIAPDTPASNKTEECTEKDRDAWQFWTAIIGKGSPEGRGKRMVICGDEV